MDTTTTTPTLHLELDLDAGGFAADDCARAELVGVVRRALHASAEFRGRYRGRLVGLVVEIDQSMNTETYRTAWRV